MSESASQRPASASRQGDQSEFTTSVAEFSRTVEQSAGLMSNAAEQFLSRISGVVAAGDRLEQALEGHRDLESKSRSAVDEAVAAASKAAAAAEQAIASQRNTEALLEQMRREHGDLVKLADDLRERIAALAVLARPVPGQASAAASAAGATQAPLQTTPSAPPAPSTRDSAPQEASRPASQGARSDWETALRRSLAAGYAITRPGREMRSLRW